LQLGQWISGRPTAPQKEKQKKCLCYEVVGMLSLAAKGASFEACDVLRVRRSKYSVCAIKTVNYVNFILYKTVVWIRIHKKDYQ
jgi:hypothetical protein